MINSNGQLSTDLKRYNLVMPTALWERLIAQSAKRHETTVATIRRLIVLGLTILENQEHSDFAIIIRQNGHEKEIMVI